MNSPFIDMIRNTDFALHYLKRNVEIINEIKSDDVGMNETLDTFSRNIELMLRNIPNLVPREIRQMAIYEESLNGNMV